MNILFVNYGDYRSNSIGHIAAFANELSKRGHSCTLAIAKLRDRCGELPDDALFAGFTHQEIIDGKEPFADAKPADIIHAWTPRESVRAFVQTYLARSPYSRLIIHLEDNEEAILENVFQDTIENLRTKCAQPEGFTPNPLLSHPVEMRGFIAQADGITLLRPSLAKLIPTPIFCKTITPIYRKPPIISEEQKKSFRRKIGVTESEILFAFPGNVTISNRADVRDLYLAIRMLQLDGYPCRVAKTGLSCENLTESLPFPIDKVCIELGHIPHPEIPVLLAAANILVQPGRNNSFNRDRFPCKIPELLISGTPCIIPQTYSVPDESRTPYCLLLETSSPEEIADKAKQLIHDPHLSETISRNAQSLAEHHYFSNTNADQLENFYSSVRSIEKKRSTKSTQALNAPTTPLIAHKKQLEEANLEIARLNKRIAQLESRIPKLSTPKSNPPTSFASFLKSKLFRTTNIQNPIAKHAPPRGHPSHHKDYYKFVQLDEQRIERYISSYRSNKAEESVKISILLPVYNVDKIWLDKCIASVINQSYANWELCISDDASTRKHIRPTIEQYASSDNRIKYLFREENGHISQATNSAFSLSTGSYVALLDHDDELAPHALSRVASYIKENPNAKLIYSDEDKIDEDGIRHGPHFKSDWNYDLFLGCNMISHLGVYERSIFEKVGGFRTGYEGAQDWDLALRVIEQIDPDQIVHIPEILYHWRNIDGSTAQSLDHKNYASKAQKRAIESHLSRIGTNATLENVHGIDWKVNYSIPTSSPKVSIIIPTRDRIDLLEPCINSILDKTDYNNFEIVIANNDSQEFSTHSYLNDLKNFSNIRIVEDNGTFNYSRINNRAIETCNSELICLLNNDTEVISPEWLREMVQHAIRNEVGVVGAKLLFPHEHVQHGGVIMGIGGIAAHAFKFLHKDDDGHIHRAHLVSQYSATTGACMLFKRKTWEELNGLDERNLQNSYNDIDFCLRAKQIGLSTIVTPFAALYHKESTTRGSPYDNPTSKKQFEKESEYMREKWGHIIASDPYYNPNLTKDKEDFSYNLQR